MSVVPHFNSITYACFCVNNFLPISIIRPSLQALVFIISLLISRLLTCKLLNIQGMVAVICVVEDGSFISYGKFDETIQVFDGQYQMIWKKIEER